MSKTRTIFDQMGIHKNYHGQAKNKLRAQGKAVSNSLDVSELSEDELKELATMLREFIARSKSRALGPNADDPEPEPEPKQEPPARYNKSGGLLTAEARFKLEHMRRRGNEVMGIFR